MTEGAPASFDVAHWLAELGLAEYASAFRDNDIDAEVLARLAPEDLRELGVRSVGHRRRLLDAIARLRAPATAAEPAAAPTQRRQVTMLFCDLVGSTALASHADPEDMREFLHRYRQILTDTVHHHDGHVAQYQGDGVVAYFGFPNARERDAENAVAAGLAVLTAIARLPPFAGSAPAVRIGIATGLTVIGQGALHGEQVGEGAIGETPNLAARIETLAAPNTVVIAERTRRLVEGLFECRALGAFVLKGFDQPVEAWQVLRRAERRSRFDALHARRRQPRFVGREPESACLRACLAEARAGKGQLVSILGDGGMGKSRLVADLLVAEVPISRAIILQCTPYNVASPFHPIRYALGRRAGIRAGDGADRARGKLRALLARSGPVPAERLALIAELLGLARDAPDPLAGLAAEEVRARGLRALLELLRAGLGRIQVVVIEDLQWIDPSTSELLAAVVAALAALPLLLIATSRPGTLPEWASGAAARRISLERLPREDALCLLADIAQPAALDPAVAKAIVDRSDGVPIFVEELTRGYLDAAARQGASGWERATIPSSLAESLLAQLDRLADGRRIAPIAAVIAREFPLALLGAVAGLPEPTLRRGVRELLDAGVLIKGHSPFGEAVSFRHHLVRDTAYQLLLRADRTRLHLAVAEAIETRFPAIAAAAPHILAIHLEAAGRVLAAAASWRRAAAAADQRSAHAEAVTYSRRGLAAIETAPAGRQRDEAELELRLDLIGPMAASRGFADPEFVALATETVALARRLGIRTRLVPVLGALWVTQARRIPDSLRLAREMTEAAVDGDEIDRLIAARLYGTSLLFSGALGEARVELERFLALYEPSRHGGELARYGVSSHAVMAMLGLAEIHTIQNDAGAARVWRERTLAGARADGRIRNICQPLVFAGCLLAALIGDDAALIAAAEEMTQLTESEELHYWRGHAELFAGLAAVAEGRAAAGFALARTGIDRLEDSHAFSNAWYIVHADACIRAGRTEEAARSLALAELGFAQGELWMGAELLRLRAHLRLAAGDGVAADADFAAARDLARRQEARLFLERIEQDMARLARPGAAVRRA